MAPPDPPDLTDENGELGAGGELRLTEPADAAQQPRLPFPVVGLGASAGGLEAYTEFLDATPADTGMAFVLVQHLPPDRESLVADILSRHTAMPVAQVEDGQPVRPDHVYVIRPGRTLTIRDGRLHLSEPLAARGHGRPVDDFFRSLAEEQQQRAVAVVLSGMGSNGTAGAEAVKAVGGLVVAQEPESAKYPSMPRSVVDANLADFILRPAEIPDALVRYARHPYVAAEAAAELVAQRDRQAFGEILAVLRTRTRHDFAGYRKATLLRRIQRRMGLTRVDTIGEYAKVLRQTAAEVSALADDLLIHVTGFFRDPEAWEAVREKVIEPLADERPDGGAVRAWVSACATGEEAYTLAMLLLEAAEARAKRFDVKVFATDMAERALGQARAGVFPNGIESEVTPERLGRFFDKDDSFYQVKKELREAVIFAPQNVLQDPPFSRLDIATCRNLLIYLEPETQQRVLALLHFGLREGGALLLGNSESIGAAEGGDFEPLDKKHRLYRRVGPSRYGTLDLPLPYLKPADGTRPPDPGRGLARPPVAQAAHRLLLEHFAPAAVVADGQGQIVYFHGDTGRYLDQPRGEPTRDLLALATDQVRGAVRTALQRAVGKDRPVIVRDGLIETKDGRRRVEVAVVPLDRRPEAAHYLVVFTDYPENPPPAPPDPDAPADARLADELVRVRDELQSALEEMQTSNEELKASHEEVTSVNEELQSTNEELETSKEELQSLNEELTTVNAQLQAKMAELEGTNNDIAGLLASTDIAVLFLDPRFRIRRFTPATKDLFDLIPSDLGRPLADLRRKFADPDLLADAQQVLDKLSPVEREVGSESGRAYLRRVLPYRTLDNRIDGVVVAFVDVTERRANEAAVRASEEQFRRAVEDAPVPVIMQAEDGRVLQVSRTWTELTGYALADVPTADAWLTKAYGPGADAVRAHMHELFGGDRKTLDVEFAIRTRGGADRHWSFSASAPGTLRDGRRFLVGMAVDVTDRKRAEERQAFLLKLSDALRPLADPGAMAAAALRLLAAHLRLDRTYVASIHGPDRPVQVVAEHGRDDLPPMPRQLRPADFPEGFKKAAEGVLAVADTRADPALTDLDRQSLDALALTSFVVAPLHRGAEGMIWALVAGSRSPRAWTDGEVALVAETAERVWAAVERAKAEAALRDRDEQLSLAQRAARLGVSSLDLATGVGVTTPEWREVVGFPDPPAPQDFATFLALVHPDDRDRVAALHDPPADHLDYEYRVNHPRLGERWLLSRAVRLPGADGGPGRMVGLAMDVTDRKRAEEAVRESEARFRGLAETVPQLVWTSDDTDIGYFNPQWYAYTGRDPAAGPGPGDDWAEVVHPDDRAETARRVEHVLRTGEPYENAYRLRRADGEYRWHIARAVRLPGSGRWVGTATDVHDLRRAAEELRAGEARFRAVAENLPSAAVFVVGPDLRYVLAEGQGMRDVGFVPADFEGKALAEALPPELVARYEANYRRALAGEPFQTEHRSHGRHYITHGVPLREAGGAVTAVLAVSYDITARVDAEAARREAEERFRLLVENARDHAIFGLGPDGTVTTWNEGAERVFGYPAAEAVGLPGDHFFTPEDRASGMFARERATAAADGRAGDDNWLVRKDGTRFWASGATSAVRDAGGRLTGFSKVVRDRTEARAAEDAVRRAEEQLRLTLTAARMGVWQWEVGADAHTRDANLNGMLGQLPAKTRQPFADFLAVVHPDDRAAVAAAFDASVRRGRPLNAEFRVVWPDGTVRWLRDQGDVFGQPDDDTLHMSGAAVDVTERREAEEALRKARDELEVRVQERTAELAAAYAALEEQFAQRRDLARRMATASEEQRGRISRELHDEMGQLLAGLSLGLKALETKSGPADVRKLGALVDRIGKEAHRIALELRPTALDDLGLAAALRNYAEEWGKRTGVAVDCHCPDPGVRLPPEVESTVYRIVQEALTNVVKHAGATRVGVMVERRPGQLTAIVEDDGKGFEPGELSDPRRPGDPLGLAGMRERAALLGGKVDVESSPGKGTTVFARFPLDPDPPAAR